MIISNQFLPHIFILQDRVMISAFEHSKPTLGNMIDL